MSCFCNNVQVSGRPEPEVNNLLKLQLLLHGELGPVFKRKLECIVGYFLLKQELQLELFEFFEKSDFNLFILLFFAVINFQVD